uniref:Uncharacterized protein n=1 Tax=Abalone asfa-like virus TaxID=2839893 RepID=A0A5K7Y3B6_9VIRU|nr:hypothetical protein [Abalone asfa-like virus]BCY04626.1 hypothetical protein [Abalone asfa-like virus]
MRDSFIIGGKEVMGNGWVEFEFNRRESCRPALYGGRNYITNKDIIQSYFSTARTAPFSQVLPQQTNIGLALQEIFNLETYFLQNLQDTEWKSYVAPKSPVDLITDIFVQTNPTELQKGIEYVDTFARNFLEKKYLNHTYDVLVDKLLFNFSALSKKKKELRSIIYHVDQENEIIEGETALLPYMMDLERTTCEMVQYLNLIIEILTK